MSKSLGNVVDPLDVMTGKDLDSMAKQLEDAGFSPTELEKAREGQRLSFPEVCDVVDRALLNKSPSLCRGRGVGTKGNERNINRLMN